MSPMNLVSPVYEARAAARTLARRLPALAGVRVGLLDNDKPKADRLLEHVAALLAERHGVRDFVRVRKGSATKPAEPEHLERLRREVDAVVTAIGD